MAPKLADLADRIFQNQKLFDRIKAVYETRKTAGLSPEQQRLAWLLYTDFVRGGAARAQDGELGVLHEETAQCRSPALRQLQASASPKP